MTYLKISQIKVRVNLMLWYYRKATALIRGEFPLKFKTLAKEKTRSFDAYLKRPYLFGWYLSTLLNGDRSWHRLSSSVRNEPFKIDQQAFFRKHFWFHFTKNNVSGWIPVKHFRKNHCQLNLTPFKNNLGTDPRLACVILLCRYVHPKSNVKAITSQYRQRQPRTVDDFFSIVTDQVGHFKNLSHKSMRRIRSQIWHQRPVVMKIALRHQIYYIVVTGFNRRIFSYIVLSDDNLQYITRKQLIRAWRKCNDQAFSCWQKGAHF